MKCRKCQSRMIMQKSESSDKCVQIWYECDACGSHMLSSTPSELFEFRDVKLAEYELNSKDTTNRRFNLNGASIN